MVYANTRTVDFAGRKADKVQEQRFDTKLWSQPKRSSLQGKSFKIEEWEKHYSPVGTKRAPITASESREKNRFSTKMIERKSVNLEMSRWNERMARLHQQAGISVDDKARIAADRKLYHMMLQDTQAYADLGEELSLRQLNRFQFRRNRSDGEVPVQGAGSGR